MTSLEQPVQNNIIREEAIESEEPPTRAEPQSGRLARLLSWASPQSVTARIVVLNLVGLVILVVGILYFNQFRQGLIDARMQSLTTQAQIISAAIASAATIDTGSIVINPDSLSDANEPAIPDADQLGELSFPIEPERAGPVLKRLLTNTTIRGRIIDPDGNLVVDSQYLYGQSDIEQNSLPEPQSDQGLTKIFNQLYDWAFAYNYPKQKEYTLDNGLDFVEVRNALNGVAVGVVRLDEQNNIIVGVGLPIQRFRAVLGVLVLSTTGGEIDDVLRAEQRIVMLTFSLVALVTLFLSLLLAQTIAGPIKRLSAAADRVRRGIDKRVEIPDFTKRKDEIGRLSSSLRDMTSALYTRMEAIEGFAADVSHELKNPLTSLRSAVETLPLVKTDESRERLVAIIKDDVRRLDRLITDISNASRVDAELARAEPTPLNLAAVLENIINLANEMRKTNQAEIMLQAAPLPKGMSAEKAYSVQGHDSRLGQVFRNLFDNARSFTKEGSQIIVKIRRLPHEVEVRIEDQGPGIRPENLERVFERFYTDRPEAAFGKNSGLGLAISRQIIEAHKGKIWAENRYAAARGDSQQAQDERPILGARFIVKLPAL